MRCSAMRQVISRSRPSLAFMGLIVTGILWLSLRPSRHQTPIAFGIARGSIFSVTNTTSREIVYRVSHPQFKCSGVWAEFLSPAEYIWQGTGQPLLPIPAEALAAGTSSTVAVSRPTHITAPLLATTWRVGVVWRYASPTRFQRLQDHAIKLISGCPPPLYTESQTNFSPEIPL